MNPFLWGWLVPVPRWFQPYDGLAWFVYGCLERECRLNMEAWTHAWVHGCQPPGVGVRKSACRAAPYAPG